MSLTKKKPDSGKTSPYLNQPSDAMSLHSQGVATITPNTPSNSNSNANSIVHRYRDDFSDHDHNIEDNDSDSSMSFVAGDESTNDPPPMYTDDPSAIAAAINPLLPASAQAALPGGMHLPVPTRTDSEGNETFVDRRLDTDPVYLEHTIAHLALFPPRPYARVVGTHTETSTSTRSSSSSSHGHNNGHGRTETQTDTRTVTDFDVRVDLTPFLYRGKRC
jgi:hypothetical protein